MDCVESFNDPRLKPRLLRLQIRDRLPDDKRPVNFSHLSSAVSAVKTHGLLREYVHTRAYPKLANQWKDAFDAWIGHVLGLVSSSMPDKQLVGVSLLGITFVECNSDRFMVSYSGWFQSLYDIIQNPGYSHFIGVAVCASFSDLLRRLAEFTKLRKDATSLTVKIIQPVLQMLDNDTIATDALWVGAIRLLCTAVTFFPSTLNRHYNKVEASIVSKIMSGKYSAHVSKELAHCLALLPKARGDAESWSLMMQRILIAINTLLDDAFEGLNEGNKSSEILRFLVPLGKEPPSPLGGDHAMLKEEYFIKRVQDLLVPRVLTLTQCACMMLTTPYSVPVVIPIHPLLAIVERVLLVDGSLPESSVFTTSLHQELLCSEIPALQLNTLDLLIAVIKGVRSQLLPFAARVACLLKEYIRRATFPHIRIKLYAIMQDLLISMGAGMVQYLYHEIVVNAFADLGSFACGLDTFSLNKDILEDDNGFLYPRNHKKRKHVGGLPTEEQISVEKPPAPRSVQLAALEALSALLTMGGSLIRSQDLRSNVDNLLVTVATKTSDGERNLILTDESTPKFADLRLAALQALKVSLLSPGCIRPPYLYKGLELFRRGKRETGTKIASVCVDALLALEVLIHPRTLPAMDFQLQNKTVFVGDRHDHIFPSTGKSKAVQPELNNLDSGVNENADDWPDDERECEVLVVQNGASNQLQKMGNSQDLQSEEEEEDMELSAAPMEIAGTTSDPVTIIEDTVTDTKDLDLAVEGQECSALLPSVDENFYYDSDDSDSLDSMPAIVNIEPDSD